MQKSHPFGFSENRFKWVNIYSNGNDLNYHKKFFRRSVDNLEGGIGHYFSKIKKDNEKKMKQSLLSRYLNNTIDMKQHKYKYQNVNSQRVIYPERDSEIERASKKKTYENSKSNLLNCTNGKISSLFLRTPWIIKGTRKKILNYSVDYGRKRDTDMFADSFLNDKEYNRIPGVLRKGNVPRINLFINPISRIDRGKKHFH